VGSDGGARSLLMRLVRVLAVCGVCMGVGVAPLLLEPVLLLGFRTGSLARHVNWQGYGIPGFPYRGDTVYVTAATSLLLAAASVAALSMRPWGRVGMAWYATTSVAHLGVLLTVPPVYAWYFQTDQGGGARNFINELREVAVLAATVATSLGYPVVVAAVMRHPAVVALFQRPGIGFEPRFSSAGPDAVRDAPP
jgi:hypothetical protein